MHDASTQGEASRRRCERELSRGRVVRLAVEKKSSVRSVKGAAIEMMRRNSSERQKPSTSWIIEQGATSAAKPICRQAQSTISTLVVLGTKVYFGTNVRCWTRVRGRWGGLYQKQLLDFFDHLPVKELRLKVAMEE